MKRAWVFSSLLLLLAGCGQLDSIPYSPAQTPETWLKIQPFTEINFGLQKIYFMQPSTSAIVYLLGILTIGVGIYFLKIRQNQKSRLWWGVALLLWGLGAILAGTSYEAFSYAIKCAGREACLWTSWWEIAYLVVTVWSLDAMMLAVAHSSTAGGLRRGLSIYALVNAIAYFALIVVSVFVPVKFLISFEFLLVVGAPTFVALFVINLLNYLKTKSMPELMLVGAWLWMAVTIAAYFGYYMTGWTDMLWAKGMWFSENDVLHIFLIVWMLYLGFGLAPRVMDISQP